MSLVTGPAADQILSLVSSGVIGRYCVVASAALTVYDHICTIPQEVHFIWGCKLTSTVVLFYANRFLILVYAILNVILDFFPFRILDEPHSPLDAECELYIWLLVLSCTSSSYTTDALVLCLSVLWAAFSATRVYALSGGSRLLAFGVALLSLVPVGTNAYTSLYGINWQMINFPVLGPQLEIGARTAIIFADTMVLIITWSKTWATVRIAREHNVKMPVMTILLRDGTFYFIGLLSLNVLNIVGITTNAFTLATLFLTPLSSAIITHFLLNLRQVALDSDYDDNCPSFVREGPPEQLCSRASSLRVGSFLDHMGGSLAHGSEEDDIDAAWDNDVQQDRGYPPTGAQMMSGSEDSLVFQGHVPNDTAKDDEQADVRPLAV
ncbi:hypothetical protein CERSUDRAFT_98836 [Gelatoporia subvermispora B]|uniref:DUF6533 domain-containing protein n=1 Tax=Ceriporiopsis subvermispora (strain B) TaxID=914234 RepID=M2R4V6_CERS8|nr:hypothetical protein CERSUDRAFT_98836 [Gelatoporia subvermispora B]